MSENIGDLHSIGKTLGQIGILERKNKNYETALNYLTKALIIFQKIDIPSQITKTEKIMDEIKKEIKQTSNS